MTTQLTTVCVELNTEVDYVATCIEMVKGYLEYTDFSILVCTNVPHKFDCIKDPRFEVSLLDDNDLKWCTTHNGFDETLKFEALKRAYTRGKDVVYLIDSDLQVVGWDEESWQRMIGCKDVDVWTTSPINDSRISGYTMCIDDSKTLRDLNTLVRCCQTNELRLVYPHNFPNDNFIECAKVRTHREDRVIYTNRELLERMFNVWNNHAFFKMLFSDVEGSQEWRIGARGGHIAPMMGVAEWMVKASVRMVPKAYAFTKYEEVIRKEDGTILDRWWLLKDANLDHLRG